MSLYKLGWVGLLLLGCFSVCPAQASIQQASTELQPIEQELAGQELTEQGQQGPAASGVIKLETTIRASREQPKVMSIVPWQPPSQKQVLPSPILQRMEQKFKPLKRDEFQRQIQAFEKLSTK